jgi:hypothetical protein
MKYISQGGCLNKLELEEGMNISLPQCIHPVPLHRIIQ